MMSKLRCWKDWVFLISITLVVLFLAGERSYAEEEGEVASSGPPVSSEPVFSDTISSSSFEESVSESSYEGNESYEESSENSESEYGEEDSSETSGSEESAEEETTPPVSEPTPPSNKPDNGKPEKVNVKVTICHKGTETITVADEATINGHLQHGDTVGACPVVVTPPATPEKPTTGKPATDTTSKPVTNPPTTDKPTTQPPVTTEPTTPGTEPAVTTPPAETPTTDATDSSNTPAAEETNTPTPPDENTDTVEEVEPFQCTTDKQCPRGEVCENNECVPVCKRLGCCNDGDCPTGQICENAECVVASRCVFNSDCGNGQQCLAGRCMAFFDESHQCQDNENCGDSEFCINNQCVSCSLLSCCTDGNCDGKTKKCCNGTCQQCCTNSDCRNGSCIDGKCQSNELAVLASFDAMPLEKSIALTWETAAELDNAGFHIWRAQVKDGHFVDITRLTAQLIPSRSMMDWLGASYDYEDATIVPGITYYYALEDIDFYGVSTVHLDMITSTTVTVDAVLSPIRQEIKASKGTSRPSPCGTRVRKADFLKFK